MNRRDQIKGEAILLLVAVLWGSCFIFQKRGMDFIGPLTLGTFRFLIGGLTLLPVITFFSIHNKKNGKESIIQTKNDKRILLMGGLLCGLALFFAATLQQIGLVYTTAGKAAFLTSMEIVLVEIVGIFVAKKLQIPTVIGVIFAVSGMYFLCITSGFVMEKGDLIELAGALFWGIQVLLVDKYSKETDGIKLSFIQFMVVGFLSMVGMFIFEKPEISQIIACRGPILYTAIVEVTICYTLQIIGQKYVTPVAAAVTLSLEAVVAVLFGALLLQEIIGIKEVMGMVMMLAAVIIIQVPHFTVKT